MIIVKERKDVPHADVRCGNCGSLLQYGNTYLLEDYHSANGARFNYYFNCPVTDVK